MVVFLSPVRSMTCGSLSERDRGARRLGFRRANDRLPRAPRNGAYIHKIPSRRHIDSPILDGDGAQCELRVSGSFSGTVNFARVAQQFRARFEIMHPRRWSPCGLESRLWMRPRDRSR
jgi:hypothetical protein